MKVTFSEFKTLMLNHVGIEFSRQGLPVLYDLVDDVEDETGKKIKVSADFICANFVEAVEPSCEYMEYIDRNAIHNGAFNVNGKPHIIYYITGSRKS